MTAAVSGWRLGAIEVVGEDGGEALVGERADRDGPGRDGFRPGGIEPAEQPQDPEAGAEALLGMGSRLSTAMTSPSVFGPIERAQRWKRLRRPLGIAPMGTRHVIGIGAVPAPAVAALMSGDPLAAVEDLDGAAGQAHVDLLADQGVRHRSRGSRRPRRGSRG